MEASHPASVVAEQVDLPGTGQEVSAAGLSPAFARLCGGLTWIVAAVLVVMLALILANIVARSLFAASWTWTSDATHLALSMVAFFGGAVAHGRRRLPSLTFLSRRLAPEQRAVQDVAVEVVVAAVGLGIAWNSLPTLVAASHLATTSTGIATTWFDLPIPIGMLLIAAFSLDRLGRYRGRPLGRGLMWVGVGLAVVLLATQLGLLRSLPLSTLSMAVGFAILLLTGVPIPIVLLGASALYLFTSGSAPVYATVTNMTVPTSDPLLIAVPFFVLTGTLMSGARLSQKLSRFADSLLGRFHGGSLHVVVATMYMFSGLSGSKSADVSAVGSALEKPLRDDGYAPGEIAAVLAASAVMGETIPPSITILILGSVTSISVGALFLAGLTPAALMAVFLMAGIYVQARARRSHPLHAAPLRTVVHDLLLALPVAVIPVVLVAGIGGGIASPSEASSFAVVVALILALAYRAAMAKAYAPVLRETATFAGMVLFIVSCASAVSWAITNTGLPTLLTQLMAGLGNSTTIFMLMTVVVMPIMGLALEGIAAILVFAPVLVPIAGHLGISTVQYGIVLMIGMSLGGFAPPIGWLLYVTCAACHATVEETIRPLLRYWAILVVGLVVLAFVPFFSLIVPHLVMHVPLK